MKRFLWVSALILFVRPPGASAVIEVIPTLGQVIIDATNVVVLEVEKVSLEKKVIVFRKVADLKGKFPGERIHHQITEGLNPREPKMILDWAIPGKTAVWFHNGKIGQACIGHYWYETYALPESSWWSMLRGTGYFCSVYYGSTDKLRRAVTDILDGKEVDITMSSADSQYEYYRGAEIKNYFRAGQFNVYRLRASLKLKGDYMHLMFAGKLNVRHGLTGLEDVPRLIEALKNPDARARAEAADDLWLCEHPAREAALPLRTALQDSDVQVRLSAARALARTDPAAGDGLAALTEALKDASAPVRRSAAEALGSLGKAAESAVASLAAALADVDPSVRWSAIDALGEIGPKAQAAVPSLVPALADPSLRGVTVEALGEIGAGARAAAPALVGLLKDKDPALTRSVAIALLEIGTEQKAAARVIVERLKHTQSRPSIGPRMKRVGESPDSLEEAYGFMSLCRYFGNTPGALPAIAEVLAEEVSDTKQDLAYRRRCASRLPQFASRAAAQVVAALRETVKDEDEVIRAVALGTVLGLKPELEPSNPELTDLLQRKAQVGGKYKTLLKRISVPSDYGNSDFGLFSDQGLKKRPEYHAYKNLPEGYWVYVFPYWYIWGEVNGGK